VDFFIKAVHELQTTLNWKEIIYELDHPSFVVRVFFKKDRLTIDGHRHRGRCRRHRQSGILYLSPVPDWVPLMPVPD
jgi:hypothetical protein